MLTPNLTVGIYLVCQILTEQRRSHRPCCPDEDSLASSSWCSPPSLLSCQPGDKMNSLAFSFLIELRISELLESLLQNFRFKTCCMICGIGSTNWYSPSLHDLSNKLEEGTKCLKLSYYQLGSWCYLTANVFGISEDLLRILSGLIFKILSIPVKIKTRKSESENEIWIIKISGSW